VTTGVHTSWQSIRDGQKNRPSHREQLLSKARRIFDMVEDLETCDDVVGLVWDPDRKVGVNKSDSGIKSRESFNIEAGPRD